MKDKKCVKEGMSKGVFGYLAKTDRHTKESSDINELNEIGRHDLKRNKTGW